MRIDDPTGKTNELRCLLFSISAVMANTVRREALSGSGIDARRPVFNLPGSIPFERRENSPL
jgi:hypothetical protein